MTRRKAKQIPVIKAATESEKGGTLVEGGGEVCLEEEVEKLRRSGMSAPEISQRMGVELSWVESLISTSEAGNSTEGREPGKGS